MHPFQMALWACFWDNIGAILRAKIILLNCHPGGRAANDAEEKHKEEVRKAGGAEKPEKSLHIEDAEMQHVATFQLNWGCDL